MEVQVHVFYEYNSIDEAREVMEAMRLAMENIREEIGDPPDEISDDDDDDESIF